MAKTRVGIIANLIKPGVALVLQGLMAAFEDAGVPVTLDHSAAEPLGRPEEGKDLKDVAEQVDVLVVLGGDGTILNVCGRLGACMKPLAAVNIGTLGFLTCVTAEDSARLVELLASGDYPVSHRSIIRARVLESDGEEKLDHIGLNEITISRGTISRLVHLETWINGEPLNIYSGDGLIISTPTGSTAYSLSAGGPIVEPNSDVFVLTPICPHSLSNRAIIVKDDNLIEIHAPEQRDQVFMTVDGGFVTEIRPEQRIEVSRADFDLPLVTMPDASFYGIVRQKLGWSGSTVVRNGEAK